jgi:hypothetical protein
MKKIILLGISSLVLLTSFIYIKNNPTLYKTSYHIKQEIETYAGSKSTYKDVDYIINYTKDTNIITIIDKDGRVETRKIFKILGDTLCVPSSYIDYFIFGNTIKETKKFYGCEGKYTKEYIY